MQQVFITLQYLLKDKTVNTFIKHFDDRRIFQYADYFLFDQERIVRLFQKNLSQLQSAITFELDFFDAQQTKVVAMTIDGDFILANDQRIYVVPKSFVKEDLEIFDLALIDFFVQYEEQTLNSTILPLASLPESLEEEPEVVEEDYSEDSTKTIPQEKKGFFSRFLGK